MAIYFFDHNQDLLKIVPDTATFSAIQTQELPDDGGLLKDTLEVTVQGDKRLTNAQYMAVKSYRGNDQAFDMYQIVSENTPDDTMAFVGVQLAVYELEGQIVKDYRPRGRGLAEVLGNLLKHTDWQAGYMDDGLPSVTTQFYFTSVKEALKHVQDLTGVEFVFKVEMAGRSITDKWVEAYQEMGRKTQKRYSYGSNALTVVRETQRDEIYTALIGRGKGEQTSSGEDNDSEQVGYGRKLTFAGVEWSTANGDPLDKPKGQIYLEDPTATDRFGIPYIEGSKAPRIGIVGFDDEEDPERLLELTYEQLKVQARPKVLFKATVANIGATGIGDTVTIHRHDLDIHYQTRVRKVVRDKLNDNKTQVELGDVVYTPSTKRQANIRNIEQNVSDIQESQANLSYTLLSADGFNSITYGNVEPERKRTGDLWYRDHPSIPGETQLLIWNGEAWELLIDEAAINQGLKEAEQKLQAFEYKWSQLQKRNEEELDHFEDYLADIREDIDDLAESGIDTDKIDKAIRQAGFNQRQINIIEKELAETSDSAELALDMIGSDGVTRYSRNRVEGDTSEKIEFRDDPIEVYHNGPGFQAGQLYTISFDAYCEPMEKNTVIFNLDAPDKGGRDEA